MKALLVLCVCSFVLCACVLGDKTFTPADLPCASKVFYHEVFDLFKDNETITRDFTGYLAFYGRYMTQYEMEKDAGDLFLVVRVDMPNPDDPNTVSLMLGVDKYGVLNCSCYGYNPFDDLYRGMGHERGYFLDEFNYTSKENSTFKGVSCVAYINQVNEGEKIIHYVNDEDRTIGYEFQNASMHRVWDASYQLFAQNKDFRMPKKFPGCVDKAYDNVESEPKCFLNPDTSSSSSYSSVHPSSHHSAPSSGASTLRITFACFFLAMVVSLFRG